MNKIEILQRYAKAGYRLVPLHNIKDGVCTCKEGVKCEAPGKHPRIKSWTHAASCDLNQIAAWNKTWPDANWGIATGTESRIVVVEADDLTDLEVAELLYCSDLPRGVKVRSGSGGIHNYMKHPGSGTRIVSKAQILGDKLKIDARGDGGLIVVPPSANINGPYLPLEGVLGETPLPDIPEDWLEYLIDKSQDKKNRGVKSQRAQVRDTITEGSRNDTIFKHLCGEVERGIGSEDLLIAIAEAMNENLCDPRLSSSELQTICKSALQYTPGEFRGIWQDGKYTLPHTAVGTAELLAREMVGSAAWVPEIGWHYYDGERWAYDDKNTTIPTRAVALIRSAYAKEREKADFSDEKVLAWLRKSEDSPKFESIMKRLKERPGIARSTAEFDKDPWLINFKNGTLDLKTGKLNPHKSEDLLTRVCNYNYNPESRAPIWEGFMQDTFLGNQELINYMQKLCGYALTGSTAEQELYIFRGSGANGKSVFSEVFKHVLGPYCRTSTPEAILADDFTKIPHAIAGMDGARLVLMSEPDLNKKFSDNAVKILTGGDTVSARRLYKEYFEFQMQGKIWLLSNHDIRLQSTDNGSKRRMRIVPFDYTVPEHKRDKYLVAKLMNESEGIIAWAVNGCLSWQREGLKPPAAVLDATKKYLDMQDAVGQFLDECCAIIPQEKVKKGDMFDAYRQWATENNEWVISQRMLSQKLQEKGFTEIRDRLEGRCWKGLKLLAPIQRYHQFGAPQSDFDIIQEDLLS